MTFTLNVPQLETHRMILRVPVAADMPAMLAFLGEDRAEFYGGPMNEHDAWHKFSAYVGQWILRGYGMYSAVLKDSGETVGMAGPFHPSDFAEPEMSWLLTDAKFEGRGLAAEACEAVIGHLFSTLGWVNVVSYIDKDNEGSRKLAERLGAQLETERPCPVANCDSYRHHPKGALA